MADFDWVFTLLDSSPAKSGYSADLDTWWSANDERHLLGLEWKRTDLPTHAAFWREADETLAALWIALRRALKHSDATTLHDGTGVLEMGGGVVALIKVSHLRTTRDERVEVDFLREPRQVRAYEDGVRKVVWEDAHRSARPTASILREIGARVAHTHGYETRIMTEVPSQVFLSKGTVRVIITFSATPWETFGERSPKVEFGAAAAGALHAADDARRAADDDDE